ncbi:MAG: hypothetical protein MSA98_06945 [Spirochaetia bacterium]|nr:hypothetical protein [Spirochaetia bacterium]MCI7589036.1 hypothetical protein [Spirochaetia bacterium]
MKRHILNIFCGIVCTSVLWSLLGCSNGNEVNSVSGYYVAKYPYSNGQETIDYIADFKSVPGRVATFDVDSYGKPTKKLMDYVPYTVSGDTITFQNVKKFDPRYSSSGEGKTVRGQYDSSTNTLYLPSVVYGGSNVTSVHEFVPANEAFFENVVADYYSQYSWSSECHVMKVDKRAKTVTIRKGKTAFSPSYDENYEINNFDQYGEVILGPVPYEENGKGISLKNNSENITLEWSYDYSSDAIGSSVDMVFDSFHSISLDRVY